MYLVVASVPGSGTRFVFEHLLAGWPRCGPSGETGYFVEHVTERRIAILSELAAQHPCIVPLRHPYKVAATWTKRIGRTRTPGWQGTQALIEHFRRLITAIDPLKPYYLPIDVSDRDSWLLSINDSLGLSLETDWPVWKSNCGLSELIDSDVELVDAMLTEFSDFFSRFGYDRPVQDLLS